MRISNNQIVGFIQISSQNNPLLIDQSNREGLLNNQAFYDLRKAVISILKVLEEKRYKVRHPNPEKVIRKERTNLFGELNLDELKQAIKEQKDALTIKDTLKLVNDTNRQLKIRINLVREAFVRYRRLASLGRLVDIILHEGRHPLMAVDNEASLGTFDVQRSLKDPHKTRIVEYFSNIRGDCTELSNLFKKIEPFSGRGSCRKKTVIDIEDTVRNAASIFERNIKASGVKVQVSGSSKIKVFSSEIQQVFINLFENSLYWLNIVPKSSRRIKVIIIDNSEKVKIMFCDNGPGIDIEDAKRVFEPYFTRKVDGTGLSLIISGEIISEHDGSLELLTEGPLTGACFLITLPKAGE